MKKIQYNLCNVTEENEKIMFPVEMDWNEANEEIAKLEAYLGEYEIYDDGQPAPAEVPSQLDVIEAQVAYTALMTDTLLEV